MCAKYVFRLGSKILGATHTKDFCGCFSPKDYYGGNLRQCAKRGEWEANEERKRPNLPALSANTQRIARNAGKRLACEAIAGICELAPASERRARCASSRPKLRIIARVVTLRQMREYAPASRVRELLPRHSPLNKNSPSGNN